jgi:hypothetical protein
MNIPTATQPTPDLESLRKAIQEFKPNSHRVSFNNLKPFHDSIALLRDKQASYSVITELLEQHGVKTSRARVAEYGRIVLEGGKSRRRRKRAYTKSAVNAPAAAQPASVVTATSLLTAAPTNNFPPPPDNYSSSKSRGPRIAKIEMMSPEEYKKFNTSNPSEKISSP